jgi:hypothetical protein
VTVVRTKVCRITFSGAANFTAKVPNINGVKSTSWQHLSMKIVDNLLRHLIPVKLVLEHKHLCSLLTRKQHRVVREENGQPQEKDNSHIG